MNFLPALIAVVGVCVLAESVVGQFGLRCTDPNCALTYCPRGCTSCRANYYVYYSTAQRFSVCVRDCPKGHYKNPIGWCTQCGVDNCVSCTGPRSCTECSRGYEVDSYGGCRRQRSW